MKILCDIYKTASKEGMYLYVSREDKLTRVPEFLLQRFAKPILVTTMLLSEKKKLAQADVLKVMSEIVDNGCKLLDLLGGVELGLVADEVVEGSPG